VEKEMEHSFIVVFGWAIVFRRHGIAETNRELQKET